MTTTKTRRINPLLAAMQQRNDTAETTVTELDSMLAAYRTRTIARDGATLALHMASMAALTPVQRKRVSDVCEGLTTKVAERVAITREVFVTVNLNGKGVNAYRGNIAGGARKWLGRFASEVEVTRIYGA